VKPPESGGSFLYKGPDPDMYGTIVLAIIFSTGEKGGNANASMQAALLSLVKTPSSLISLAFS
jgi:hypothetical protein